MNKIISLISILMLACNYKGNHFVQMYFNHDLTGYFNVLTLSNSIVFLDKLNNRIILKSEGMDTIVINKGFMSPRPQLSINKDFISENLYNNKKLQVSYSLFRYQDYDETSIIVTINNQYTVLDSTFTRLNSSTKPSEKILIRNMSYSDNLRDFKINLLALSQKRGIEYFEVNGDTLNRY